MMKRKASNEVNGNIKQLKSHWLLIATNEKKKQFGILISNKIDWLDNIIELNDGLGIESTLIETKSSNHKVSHQKRVLFNYYLENGYTQLPKQKEL